LRGHDPGRYQRPGRAYGVLYAVADDFEAMIRQENQLIGALAAQLKAGAGIVASREVNARFEEMAKFYLTMRGAMDDAMRRWKRNRS